MTGAMTDRREYLCPDCHRPLQQIDARPGKEAWVCPVAIEAKRRGYLGQPGRVHKEAVVFVRKSNVGRKPLDSHPESGVP